MPNTVLVVQHLVQVSPSETCGLLVLIFWLAEGRLLFGLEGVIWQLVLNVSV
jgi:hypothetical protein